MNLDRRGINIDTMICSSCDSDVESPDHTFFLYPLRIGIRSQLARWWQIDMPNKTLFGTVKP